MFSTYQSQDVTILLKDITGLVTPLGTREREARIQSGVHYSEMLPLEYEPSPAYLAAYHDALERYAGITAEAVARAAEQIWESRGRQCALVSLARAGTPIGILIRRYLQGRYGADLPHYTISIIRGRGIDRNAMAYLLNRHAPGDIQFVDGWTGKGAIQRQLDAAMTDYPGVSPGLTVLSDPANVAAICGTHDDFLIASSCLNSTVSGLLSRTFLRGDIISPGDFHGAAFYRELKDQDLTYQFIDTIQAHFPACADAVPPAPAQRPGRTGGGAPDRGGLRHPGHQSHQAQHRGGHPCPAAAGALEGAGPQPPRRSPSGAHLPTGQGEGRGAGGVSPGELPGLRPDPGPGGHIAMGTILFASDLDNTLLFSHRHRQPEDRCVERLNGAEQGFFTRETPDLLPQVVQRVHLLPITTRSIEQYQRIQWPDGTAPRIALTANGAVLLRDGQVDRAWYAASQALVRDHREALAAVLDHLTRQGGATSVRCVEGVYVYAAYPDIPAAERVARDWCGGSALQAVVSGRKVYFFPPGIDKGTALRRAVERFGPERVIAAGDSVIDVPMLRQADLALIPDAELLPRLPRERTRVCGRDCRFPDFVLENVLRYAASLENT